MKIINSYIKCIDKISEYIGKIAMWSSIVLLLLIVFEVFSRRFFNKPTVWTYEASNMIFGFFILMTIPYGMLHGVNVSVEIFSSRWSDKTKKIMAITTYILLLFPFLLGILYGGFEFALTSLQMEEKSWSVWSPPLYPIKMCIPIAALFAFLQGISELLKICMAKND